MKSRRESNTRFRLILTLGLAVVLPALTLIYVNFQHVKSIQRGKKFEALIHRDFQYLLSNSAQKMSGKAYELTEKARDEFPSDTDSDDEKRRKFDLLLAKNPWFTHVVFYDAKKGVIVQQQRGQANERELAGLDKMYDGWFSLDGTHLVETLCKKTKPIMWYSGESDGPNGSVYTTTGIFAFPQLTKDRALLGAVSFDPNYLKQNLFPQLLEESTTQKLSEDPQDANEPEDQRLAMIVYPADALHSEPDRPFATSTGWNGGKPEVSLLLDNPFRGLALGVKFQGTTAQAIAHRWVVQSFAILGVLSVLMIGGLGIFLFCFCLVRGEKVASTQDFGWQSKGEDHFGSWFPFFPYLGAIILYCSNIVGSKDLSVYFFCFLPIFDREFSFFFAFPQYLIGSFLLLLSSYL